MGSIKSIPMTIPEVCSDIADAFERSLTERLLTLFSEEAAGYLVSATNPKRVYCYIRKSKESAIINKETYQDRQADGGYSLQIRITSAKTYQELDKYTENVRAQILDGRDCKMPRCCNCGHWYTFEHHGAAYRKCHMLCDNYAFSHLHEEDADAIFAIIRNEFPKKK